MGGAYLQTWLGSVYLQAVFVSGCVHVGQAFGERDIHYKAAE